MTDNKAVGPEVWEMICVIVSQKVKISLLIRQPALHKMSERFALGPHVRRIRQKQLLSPEIGLFISPAISYMNLSLCQ